VKTNEIYEQMTALYSEDCTNQSPQWVENFKAWWTSIDDDVFQAAIDCNMSNIRSISINVSGSTKE